jgi:ribonuclease T1
MKAWRVLWLLLAGMLLFLPLASEARSHHHAAAELSSVAVADLPPEGRATLQLIKQGGPFPYPRDGVVFGNYEHRLPQKPRGYYHEYTVQTPGTHGRGPRRIVCGQTQDCYYSDDHYRSFRRITEEH